MPSCSWNPVYIWEVPFVLCCSMEECEALCTRIAIMVNGQFKCLGSTQHLKTKFGEGFTLMAKVGYPDSGGQPQVEPLMEFITTSFPGSVLKDVHQGLLHFHITDTSIPWAKLFGVMESVKARFNIEDYSVSQTSLEQVFINFARSQVPPLEMKVGCCGKCGILCGSCCCCCGPSASEQEVPLMVERETSGAAAHGSAAQAWSRSAALVVISKASIRKCTTFMNEIKAIQEYKQSRARCIDM